MSKKLSTLILFQGMRAVQKEGLLFEAELDECRIEGDKDFLKSLFYNLIDNAVKASKENGKILVRMKYEEKEQVKIQVIDYGAGIPKEEIPRITEPFYTVKRSASKKTRGMGLGLALCQRIIEYHNGELEIESQPGKGSTFTVHLPLS